MTCMCGDLYCKSCGPGQGNDYCPVCGKWSLDGGCDDPKACEKILAKWDAYAEQLQQEIDKAAEDYWEAEKRAGRRHPYK